MDFDYQAIGQEGLQIVQLLAGAGSDDQVCDEGDFSGAMPAAEAGKGVGSHEAKQGAIGRELSAKGEQGVECVVGRAGGLRRISERESKSGVAGNGETGHGEAVSEGGCGTLGFERLFAYGGKEHGVEAKRGLGGASHLEMAEVRRIETASKESHARMGGGFEMHVFMVACAGAAGIKSEISGTRPPAHHDKTVMNDYMTASAPSAE
jgi:hypothetical protein